MVNQSNRFHFLLLSVLVLSLASVLIPQNIFAGETTILISSDPTVVNYRDITDLTVHPDPTLSLDESKYREGDTAILTLNDANANLDTTAIDFTFATVGGSSLTLTESAVNSDVFSGSFTVTKPFPTVEYTGDSNEAARAEITINNSPITITFSDVSFGATECAAGFEPVLGGIKITPASGTLSSKPIVTLSYANANLTGGLLPRDLQVIYKNPGEDWDELGISCSAREGMLMACDDGPIVFFDEVAKTITADPDCALCGYTGETDFQGEYALGKDVGCPGGGGGGLVSPGLVVNALAGLGGSGGGSPSTSLNNLVTNRAVDLPEEVKQMVLNHDSYSPLLPMDPDSFEDFDFPLVINDQGFVLGGFTSTLQTQTLKTDTPITMKFTLYTTDKVQHFSLYTNLRDTNDSIRTSDTQILYNDGKELQVIDPNGFFSDANITVIEEEDSIKKFVIVDMTFAKEMETSHIITRSWDAKLRSGDTHILNAIKVGSPEPEFVPIPQETEEVQVEELTSQTIPKWVKSNAEWWVDQQIDDESFVAGIQYLINNGIMYIPNTESVNSSVTEIPDWVKNNAEWWVDNQISDEEFVKAMEWLVTNGVISIE